MNKFESWFGKWGGLAIAGVVCVYTQIPMLVLRTKEALNYNSEYHWGNWVHELLHFAVMGVPMGGVIGLAQVAFFYIAFVLALKTVRKDD